MNGAALRRDRVHADLFGAAPGAHTGQRSASEGLVGAADGGTLSLDEVGDLPAEAQAQLLTFLQDGRYRRLGENRERRADARVIAATSRDVSDRAVMREDLYWRLAGVQIEVPTLADRREDLPELATAVIGELAADLGVRARPLGPDAQAFLEGEAWPGNVRELRHRLLSALLVAEAQAAGHLGAAHFGMAAPRAPVETLRGAVEAFKQRHVLRVLEACEGNKSRAAEALGMNRTYLHELLGKWAVSGGADTDG